MPFNSFTFVLFFFAVVMIHSLPLPRIVRKLNLLVASYLFYAAWEPWFVTLLCIRQPSTGLPANHWTLG